MLKRLNIENFVSIENSLIDFAHYSELHADAGAFLFDILYIFLSKKTISVVKEKLKEKYGEDIVLDKNRKANISFEFVDGSYIRYEIIQRSDNIIVDVFRTNDVRVVYLPPNITIRQCDVLQNIEKYRTWLSVIFDIIYIGSDINIENIKGANIHGALSTDYDVLRLNPSICKLLAVLDSCSDMRCESAIILWSEANYKLDTKFLIEMQIIIHLLKKRHVQIIASFLPPMFSTTLFNEQHIIYS